MSEAVLVDVEDGVATITLNRPEARNALNREVRRRLPQVITELEADANVDVMILTGADPAFSAGIDLTGMLTHTFPLDGWREAFTALATQDDSGAIKIAFDFRNA